MEGYKETERIITGNIFPAKRDKEGKITRVLIDSTDQDQDGYLIAENRKGEELVEHVYRKVEIHGIVTENNSGDLIINVKSYSILDKEDGENMNDD